MPVCINCSLRYLQIMLKVMCTKLTILMIAIDSFSKILLKDCKYLSFVLIIYNSIATLYTKYSMTSCHKFIQIHVGSAASFQVIAKRLCKISHPAILSDQSFIRFIYLNLLYFSPTFLFKERRTS